MSALTFGLLPCGALRWRQRQRQWHVNPIEAARGGNRLVAEKAGGMRVVKRLE
jgi:hypothetical protein